MVSGHHTAAKHGGVRCVRDRRPVDIISYVVYGRGSGQGEGEREGVMDGCRGVRPEEDWLMSLSTGLVAHIDRQQLGVSGTF